MAKIRAKGLEMLKLMQFLMIDVLMKNRRAIFSHHDCQKEEDMSNYCLPYRLQPFLLCHLDVQEQRTSPPFLRDAFADSSHKTGCFFFSASVGRLGFQTFTDSKNGEPVRLHLHCF